MPTEDILDERDDLLGASQAGFEAWIEENPEGDYAEYIEELEYAYEAERETQISY